MSSAASVRRRAVLATWCLAGGVLVVLAGLPAHRARAQVFEGRDFEYTTRGDPGREVQFVSYRGGRHYRLIKPLDLRSERQHKRHVCIFGKFNEGEGQFFSLIGSKRDFFVQDPAAIERLQRMDNIWVAGQAWLRQERAICIVKVDQRGVVRLANDFTLFNERYDRHAKEKDWRRLVEDGRWIQSMGRLNRRYHAAPGRQKDYERYADLAFYRAYRLRKSAADPNDDAELFEIARMVDELLPRDRSEYLSALVRVVRANPEHRGARELLIDQFGYVVDPLTNEVVAPDRITPVTTNRPPTGNAHPVVTAQSRRAKELARMSRAQRLWEVRRAARSGRAGAIERLADEIIHGPDDDLAVFCIRQLAAARSPQTTELLLGLRTESALRKSRRAGVADALAWTGDPASRDFLVATVLEDQSESVRGYAAGALAWIGDADAIGRLVKLLPQTTGAVQSGILAELRQVTGQSLAVEAWPAWWERNREDPRFAGEEEP